MDAPHIVIVGGGFGGLAVARGLRRAAVRITLVDRTNHHLFQPLLYQVATAMLAPAEIATPIRHVLARQQNATVLLAELIGIEAAARRVRIRLPDGSEQHLAYDRLVLATGATHSYFGHDEFAPHAPGLKTLVDATAIRGRILGAFEEAESLGDPERTAALLTFVLVGGGPTGVEMAGAIAELRRYTLRADFRRIDPLAARILLVEAAPRILGQFPEKLADKVRRRLERLGVEVLTGQPVEQVDGDGVIVGGRRIASRTVIWTAGVAASPSAGWLGAPTDRAGRVIVEPDGRVPGLPDVYVLGDAAHWIHEGKPLPGVAPVAMQQGAHVAQVIRSQMDGTSPPAFRYRDHGNLAVVGRGFALFHYGRLRLGGWIAWLLWVFVHIANLAAFMNRLRTMTQWGWTYFTLIRGSRLILEPAPTRARRAEPRERPGILTPGPTMPLPPFLLASSGAWQGSSRLQDPHTSAPDESASELVLTPILAGSFARIDYTWSYRRAPQSGMMLVGQEKQTGGMTLAWVDTWHMGDKIMLCQGELLQDRAINVRGSYAAPPGPDWGWRIVIDTLDVDALRIVMHNIWPEGKEELAVEARYLRKQP